MSVGPVYRVAPTGAVLAALCLPVTAEGQSGLLGTPHFELYTGCAPVGLLVSLPEDVPGLTRSAV